MPDIARATLFGKLDALCWRAIEGATVLCKLRGNPQVELAHWLQQLLGADDSDLHRIVRQAGIDAGALAADLTRALDRLPRGAEGVRDLSGQIDAAVERAWVHASLQFGASRIRSLHLLVALLRGPTLRAALLAISRQFERIDVDALLRDAATLLADSPEQGDGGPPEEAGATAPGETSGAIAPAALGRQDALQRYTTDLTAQAREQRMDPIVGRDDEIRQLVDILMRRRQNNPILIGEAGVGKTAVVEGFAQRIVRGDVPPALREVSLRALDVGLLQAGASMKGEFEQRLRAVIDEVQASPQPVILFIDETHTLVGAGGAAGTGDAANLLKPALARGQLRTIGATTFTEYRKYIEKDPALTRRFQAVQVDEPDEARALRMMRGVAATLAAHHRVQLLDEALEAAVRLSHRYIPARQLPDKAVSLLDTACARVAVSLHATPAAVDDARQHIAALLTEQAIAAREAALGVDGAARRRDALAPALDAAHATLATLEARWQQEQALTARLLALRAQLDSAPAGTPPAPDDPPSTALAELREVQQALATLQGEAPLMLPTVDAQAVASVVADWTGIPVGRMAGDEIATVLDLPRILGARVIGQDHAMAMIARRVQTSRAGLDDPGKPVGVFLLAGTSGVGKTETALALAEALYGGEQNLITINMSEYQEAHTVSSLKGSPPGYVGYGEGGVLTEAVRRRPWSVVLLDEVEKAHPDVHELFFQVFDKGWMEDGEGRVIDFRNTLILLTTNAGTAQIERLCAERARAPEPEALARALRAPLREVFPPALLGRLVTIPYYPLDAAMLARIARLQLERIRQRIEARWKLTLTLDEAVVDLVVARCTEPESGGRMIAAILTNTLLPTLSQALLERLLAGRRVTSVTLGVRDGDFDYRLLDRPSNDAEAETDAPSTSARPDA